MSAFWNQFDKNEIHSMHGIEHDEPENKDCDDESEEEDERECSCGNYCMDCLGMSWSDFM